MSQPKQVELPEEYRETAVFWNGAWEEAGLFETLPRKVQAELYDFQKMISTWSKVTYTLTGGKLGYPNYHEQVIVSEFEDYISEQIQDGVEEELAQAQQEKTATMTPQELQLELMKKVAFSAFSGQRVAKDLQNNPTIWQGALMDRPGIEKTGDKYESVIDLIKLRDLPDHWNVDTLFITPSPGFEDELEKLANTWNADEVGWIGNEEACEKLCSYSPQKRAQEKQILVIWWD